ncbi:aminopeptidase [Mucilaginibacter sp. RS28]|uniref:Aminopeptidase n=1 Tax=Mucilaginibacter straminoryzae TaxID=2932774 RepID=A0A9X1WYS9_9SPHI|nr:aminopeptidase [Mucilaginibacter straminoryzae]MCJ8208152.1 aminopeptidase [Mucilaginibacter straminoryzae]
MSKKVLAIYFTQSGQMGDIIESFTSTIAGSDVVVEKVRIYPETSFDFPWTGKRFFSVMPDCVLGRPRPLQPYILNEQQYDLVILAYQPWFLSPSIPISSLLQDDKFKAVIKDTPVVTISAGRNMWLNAFDKIKKLLADAGANHVGNVALVDRHSNPISFVTIFYWMLSGKKERYLNIFPKPGVSDQDIAITAEYGKSVARYLASGNWDGLQNQLVGQGAVRIKYPLMVIEGKAKYIFMAWAKVISKRKNQLPWTEAFKYYLFIALFIGAPILLTLDTIFVRPFSSKRIKNKTLHFLLLNRSYDS